MRGREMKRIQRVIAKMPEIKNRKTSVFTVL